MAGYRQIADIIAGKIVRGEIPDGAKIPSLHSICAEFGVSYMTAVRTHEELVCRSIVVKLPGAGTVVVGPSLHEWNAPAPEIGKVVYLHNVYIHPDADRDYSPLFRHSLRVLKAETEKRGAEFVAEYDRPVSSAEAGRLFRASYEGTAFILSNAPPKRGRLYLSSLAMCLPDVQTVALNMVFPNTFCAVNDYENGMELLAGWLAARGTESVLCLSGSHLLGNYSAAAIFYGAANACAHKGIAFESLANAPFSEVLLKLRKAKKRIAVMCPQDTVADRLKQYLLENGVKENALPPITGCDGVSFAARQWPKATVAFNVASLCRKAVEMVFTRPPAQPIKEIVRVPGKLVVPDTCEKPETTAEGGADKRNAAK